MIKSNTFTITVPSLCIVQLDLNKILRRVVMVGVDMSIGLNLDTEASGGFVLAARSIRVRRCVRVALEDLSQRKDSAEDSEDAEAVAEREK